MKTPNLNPWGCETKVFASRDEWVAGRSASIGASESAAILGEGYSGQSAFTVWYEKVHEVSRAKFSAAMLKRLEIGTMIEPSLRKIFTHVSGVQCWAPQENTMMVCDGKPWITATLDGVGFEESTGRYGPVELKNVGHYNLWEWQDGKVPLIYQIQTQHQMLVTGAEIAWIFGLIGGNEPHYYPIERNQEFIDALTDRLDHFWSLVLSRTPPEVDGSEATKECLNDITEKARIEILGEAEMILDGKRVQLEEQKKAVEGELESINNKLRLRIGDAAEGHLPNGVVYTYKTQERSGYTVAPTSFRVLKRLKPKKGK